MPAVSEKQRVAMAIAEHHPEKLYARNRGMTNMSKTQLHEFASKPGLKNTKRKRLIAGKRKRMFGSVARGMSKSGY